MWFAVKLLCLIWLGWASGQGYKPPEFSSAVLGVSKSAGMLQQQLARSSKWRAIWKSNPASACSLRGSSRNNLCAAAGGTETEEQQAAMMLGTSPTTYSSLNLTITQGRRLVGPPGDQEPCYACVAFAVTAAAETALATFYHVDVSKCSISIQSLFFCENAKRPGDCASGWTIERALVKLKERSPKLPTAECLPYTPNPIDELSADAMCKGKCSKTNPYVSWGRFQATPVTSIWQAQKMIREYGSIVSRFDVYDDFRSFFENSSNAKAIYRPGNKSNLLYGHAVNVVGYDNINNFWVAKNSWGTKWGDGGFFRVAYGVCSVVSFEAGDAYAVKWDPFDRAIQRLSVTSSDIADCYWYKGRAGDYPSRVAWLASIPLGKFLLNNTGTIKDLGTPLGGLKLLLCNPDPDSVDTAASDPQLESLLTIRKHIDLTDEIKGWNRETGAGGGYCAWQGIRCATNAQGKQYVQMIKVEKTSRFIGLSGILPPATAFKGLSGLQVLRIQDQPGIKGPLHDNWSALAGLTSLEEILLDRNGLTGTLPAALATLKSLKTLSVVNNQFRGTLPVAWKALTNLTQLKVAANYLTGTLPPEYASLRRLRSLHIWENGFVQSFPESWFTSLLVMEELQSGRCSFSGTLPAGFSRWRRLKTLYLNENNFRGTLPAEWSQMKDLEYLGLWSNLLQGSVPASWGKDMQNLRELRVYDNPQLTGCLPAILDQQLRYAAADVAADVYFKTQISGAC